jgi:hypothetical protein
MDPLEKLNQETLPFAQLLGIRLISAAPDRVIAEMLVRDDLCTRPAVLHGGAMMAFADTLGACATAINLRDGAQLPRPGARRHQGDRRMPAAPSRQAHDDLANTHHLARGPLAGRRHPDPDGPLAIATRCPTSLRFDVDENALIDERRLVLPDHMDGRLLRHLGALRPRLDGHQTRSRMDLRTGRHR